MREWESILQEGGVGLKFNEFMGELRKGIQKHVYLLSGEERYYIDRAKDRLLALLFPSGNGREAGLERITGDIGTTELIGRLETVPFFSDKNVILLENTNLFKEKKSGTKSEDEKRSVRADKTAERLTERLVHMPEDSFIIFVTKDKPDKRRKLYKAVEEAGLVLEADAVRSWSINDWLQGKLQSMNRTLDREAQAYFLNAVSMMQQISLGFLEQEFDKLALYSGERRITKQELAGVFSGLPEVSLFALMDAISEKNVRQALALLERQLSDGTYAPLVLSLLVRHVRQLWQARALMAQGIRGKELAKPLELHPYIAERLGKAAANFSDEVLEEVFLLLADADYRMKTGQAGPELLEYAVIRLCSGGSAGGQRKRIWDR